MIYLIDSSIYIFRSWQTLPGSITNTFGEPANAVFGYAETLATILNISQATHMVCAFDQSHGTGVRYDIYPQYKANRPEAPEELQVQFDRCIQTAKAFGLPAFGSQRVEADDIIGCISVSAHNENRPVTIVSADKDLMQFIHDDDIYWDYARKARMSYKDIEKKFRLRPSQIADMLALSGDKVDNIPGVPGIGQTTASRLLKKWQTLDNVLANTDKIADMKFRGSLRVGKLIDEHLDNIAISRQLTGLIHDDTLPTSSAAFARTTQSKEDTMQALEQCGFNEATAARLALLATNNTIKAIHAD